MMSVVCKKCVEWSEELGERSGYGDPGTVAQAEGRQSDTYECT